MNHFKTHIKAELHLNINGSIFQRHEFKIPVRCEESFEEWADKTDAVINKAKSFFWDHYERAMIWNEWEMVLVTESKLFECKL